MTETTASARLLEPQDGEALGAGDYKATLEAFLAPLQRVNLPALSDLGCGSCWVLPLSDGSNCYIFDETLGESNFACDCCRIVGERRAARLRALGRGKRTRGLRIVSRRRSRRCCRRRAHLLKLPCMSALTCVLLPRVSPSPALLPLCTSS